MSTIYRRLTRFIIVALFMGTTTLESRVALAETVRDRLQKTINRTRELMGQAEEADPALFQQAAPEPAVEEDRKSISPRRFPRQSHVSRYGFARPWTRHYARGPHRHKESVSKEEWPKVVQAAALRELLRDKDPAMRSVAVEALATLHQPEDVERIAALLDDKSEGLPVLGWNFQGSAHFMPVLIRDVKADNLELMRSWHNRSVRTYARQALKLMTGRIFTPKSFQEWWPRNKNAHHCLWYWQQRFQREMDREGRRDRVLAELRKLPPEVEAKICLLAVHKHAGGADITQPSRTFFTMPLSLRLGATRLLELMDREGLWEDVEWEGSEGRDNYNRLLERLALSAPVLFRPEHASHLKNVLAREQSNLWWSGRAAMIIGISRLLPPDGSATGRKTESRDGFLRSAIEKEKHVFTRGYVARELVRVGLPVNWTFLKKVFFSEKDNSFSSTDMRQSIIIELGKAPLTSEKRRALTDLLLDRRFASLWTRPSKRMGDDMYRQYAIRSVNAHAGKEILTRQHYQDLDDPKKSAVTLKEVRQKVSELVETAENR
jgi:hypothetical protein